MELLPEIQEKTLSYTSLTEFQELHRKAEEANCPPPLSYRRRYQVRYGSDFPCVEVLFHSEEDEYLFCAGHFHGEVGKRSNLFMSPVLCLEGAVKIKDWKLAATFAKHASFDLTIATNIIKLNSIEAFETISHWFLEPFSGEITEGFRFPDDTLAGYLHADYPPIFDFAYGRDCPLEGYMIEVRTFSAQLLCGLVASGEEKKIEFVREKLKLEKYGMISPIMSLDDVDLFKLHEAKFRGKRKLGDIICLAIRYCAIKIMAYIFEVNAEKIPQISFRKCDINKKKRGCYIQHDRIREFLKLYQHRLTGLTSSPLFAELALLVGYINTGDKFNSDWMTDHDVLSLLQDGKDELAYQIISKQRFEIWQGRFILPILLTKKWKFDVKLYCADLSYSLCHQILRIQQGITSVTQNYDCDNVDFVPTPLLCVAFECTTHEVLLTNPIIFQIFENAIRGDNIEYVEHIKKIGAFKNGYEYDHAGIEKKLTNEMIVLLNSFGVKITGMDYEEINADEDQEKEDDTVDV